LTFCVLLPRPHLAGKQSRIDSHFQPLTKSEEADFALAMSFYANGIPFNVARSPEFKYGIKKVAEAGEGYKPPGSEKLRSSLLDQVFVQTCCIILL
jgi:hypothetical protein